jgi:hypothetical protein
MYFQNPFGYNFEFEYCPNVKERELSNSFTHKLFFSKILSEKEHFKD